MNFILCIDCGKLFTEGDVCPECGSKETQPFDKYCRDHPERKKVKKVD